MVFGSAEMDLHLLGRGNVEGAALVEELGHVGVGAVGIGHRQVAADRFHRGCAQAVPVLDLGPLVAGIGVAVDGEGIVGIDPRPSAVGRYGRERGGEGQVGQAAVGDPGSGAAVVERGQDARHAQGVADDRLELERVSFRDQGVEVHFFVFHGAG